MFRDFILRTEQEINVKILTLYLLSLVCVAACGNGPAPDPRLIGGVPADPKEWPSSVYVTVSGARCSGTVVGERTLIFAAHCARTGTEASFTVGANNYKATCTRHPEYPKNASADWNLCLTDKPVVGGPYEVLNQDPALVKVGQKLTLSGYGCVQPGGGGGGNDGIFRIGDAPVTALPSGQEYDIVTKGNAALCFGDSGGAAYMILASSRWVVGVNSRGDIQTLSYLPAVHLAGTFFKDWAKANSTSICGVNPEAKNCRGVDDPQPLPSDFTVSGKAGKCVGKMNPGFESALQEISNRIKAVLDSVNF